MAQYILIGGLQLYRWTFSPMQAFLFGPLGRCRYTPSCSQYALQAVRLHGALGGSWLALRRLARCHPWGGCGEDPVPPVRRRPHSEPPRALLHETHPYSGLAGSPSDRSAGQAYGWPRHSGPGGTDSIPLNS